MIDVSTGMLPSYPKIYAIGHPSLGELLHGHVVVQEKVDGSQFSFGKIDGRVMIRSKNQAIYPEAAPSMFRRGVDYVMSIADKLEPGIVYRSEYLEKPLHNALSYNRVPKNHIAIYDAMVDTEKYDPTYTLEAHAERLGVDFVPTFFHGQLSTAEIEGFLQQESFLGGQRIEGVVVKNYGRFCQYTGHVLMGKYVSEAFKEVQKKEWKASNPTQGDVLQNLVDIYKTPARWQKAVYTLRDMGQLESDPRDIGKIMKLVWPDIKAECEQEIKDQLFKHFEGHLKRAVTAGLPEWYKKQLLHQQEGPGDV